VHSQTLSSCVVGVILTAFFVGGSATADRVTDEATTIQSSELSQIEAVLRDYIDGSTGEENPARVQSAFHPDFNLYSVGSNKELQIWSGADYIAEFQEGRTNTEVGKIIAIDFEDTIGTAKVRIELPGKRVFTDYFLLAKYDDTWRIIHKSYTYEDLD